MKKLSNLKGAKSLSKNEQKSIHGGYKLNCYTHANCPTNQCCINGRCIYWYYEC